MTNPDSPVTNAVTLQTYEAGWQDYIANTPHDVTGTMKDWMDAAVAHVAEYGVVLELGSGFGRDAAYLEAAGLRVVRSDAARSFVRYLRDAGHDAVVLNVLTDDLDGPYHLVFANAVFLHFTPEQLAHVLRKCTNNLVAGGVLAFTLRRGEGSGISFDKLNRPRFYQYWQPEPLTQLVKESGFGSVACIEDDSPWLHYIAIK